MHNDTIKVANKIISDNDLTEIFQKMNEDIVENNKICKQEETQNQMREFNYQNWTTKQFDGKFRCTFFLTDNTNITVDNYNAFIPIFNNRLDEIESMSVNYIYNYTIQNGTYKNFVHKTIGLNIREDNMEINVHLNSADEKMNNIYQLIKDKVLHAPERYDTIVRKQKSIERKIKLGFGMIPSLIICFGLFFIPEVRNLYIKSYVLFPIVTYILASLIGSIAFDRKLTELYYNIVPRKKFPNSLNSDITKEDIDDYLLKSEIIIGKNADNIKCRNKIKELREKYGKLVPVELILLLILLISMFLLNDIL